MKKLLLTMLCAFGLLSASAATVTDVITVNDLKSNSTFDATSTAYAEFSVTGTSGAEYALQCAHNRGTYLQFRSSNNNSGIVTTKSVGTVVSVSIEYNSQTTDRIMNVYGSNTAYSVPADLYATGVTNIGQIQAGKELTYTFASQPSYVGLRSSNGAIYIEKITIVWDTEGTPGTGGGSEGDDPVVTPPTGGSTVTFDATKQGYENQQEITTVNLTPLTLTFDGGGNTNGPKYYTASPAAIRMYPKNTITVSSTNNSDITKIEIGFAQNYGDGQNNANVYFMADGYSDGTWTGNATSVVLTVNPNASSGQVRVQTITVTYDGGEEIKVLAPVVTCENNMVSMSCATEGAEIYYDLTGAVPTNNSMKYTAAFPITETVTVKAIAYKGTDASAVTTYTANYIRSYKGFNDYIAANPTAGGTVDGPLTAIYQNNRNTYLKDSQGGFMLVYASGSFTMPSLNNGDQLASISGTYSPYAGLPEMIPTDAGQLTTGGAPVQPEEMTLEEIGMDLLNAYVVIKNVTISEPTGTTGAASRTYAISDGTNDELGCKVLYNTFYDNGYNTVVDVPVGTGFTVTGFVCINNNTLQITPISFTGGTEMLKVANPVFNPTSGAVKAGTAVTITSATADAQIYYTTDGTEPDITSTLYTEPIVVNDEMTIKAIAVLEEYIDSDVITAKYTIVNENATEATFDFTDPANYVDIEDGATEYDLTGKTLTSGPISLLSEAAEGASTKPRLFSSQGNWTYRFYKDNTITISTTEDFTINAIAFTGQNLDNASIVYSDNGTFTNGEWVANTKDGVQSMTITKTATGNNPYISKIVVTYESKTNAVDNIAADNDNAPVEYYTLQGVRVERPAAGQLVIRRQGSNVSKIIVK